MRNFVALAKAGYYDGLVFERAVHDVLEDEEGNKLAIEKLEGGCPLGTGEAGHGSIGYWMKSEFNVSVDHEEGVIGACRWREDDSAACRFYITLCKMSFFNGAYTVFGKVTQGMDVAHKIFRQPVRRDDNDPDQDGRPLKPAVIRKVTIVSK